MNTYKTSSPEETKTIALNLARTLPTNIFALFGELGSGKTTFVQGFAKGLGVKDKILSPTFVLIRQHQIPNTEKAFYHIDLYRLEDTSALKQLGLEDILGNKNNIVLIEWAEKAENILPKSAAKIYFKTIDKDKREINVNLPV